jgi:hypothetical protein
MQLGIGPAAAMHAAENLYLQGYLALFFRHNNTTISKFTVL